MQPLALLAADEAHQEAARGLARQLDCPCLDPDAVPSWLVSGGVLVVVSASGLEVRFQEADARQATRVDVSRFLARAARRGRVELGGRDLLLKAMGLRPAPDVRVLDATLGLGRDTLLLATAGFDVTALERSPVVRLLVARGLAAAAEADEARGQVIATRLHIMGADGVAWMQAAARDASDDAGAFDVVYLDPMHPPRTKSARVRKELRALQRLAGGDADADDLLAPALALARRRVVVKRPTHGEPLARQEPTRRLTGQRVRFDVYDVAVARGAPGA